MRINFYEEGSADAVFGFDAQAPPATSTVIDLENCTPLDILGGVPRKSEWRQYLVARVRMRVVCDTKWGDVQASYEVFMRRIDGGMGHE